MEHIKCLGHYLDVHEDEGLLFTNFPEYEVYNPDWHTNCFDLSLTTVGAQPKVNMKPEAQSPEFLWYFNSVWRILLISFIKDSSQA